MENVLARRITLETLQQMRAAREPIALLTCYDYPTARILASAGVHMLLVGDSAANTVLGLSSTRDIPPEFLLTITAAVRRGAPDVFVLGDMPFRSVGERGAAVATARRLISEGGADAVKVECTREDAGLVSALVAEGVATCVHVGLLPQRVVEPGGFRVQGRTKAEAQRIVEDAVILHRAGATLLLLEAVPDEVSAEAWRQVNCPVLGCGAGPSCDGHVVVLHDLLGFSARPPRFAEPLVDVPALVEKAAREYVSAIRTRAYPALRHQYQMKAEPAARPDPAQKG